ncbi:MAG: hypothetical protein HOO96_02640 [Polyangiaceae bacterium]|nr:hypothetical protein [Polyangiaceae bacterium]
MTPASCCLLLLPILVACRGTPPSDVAPASPVATESSTPPMPPLASASVDAPAPDASAGGNWEPAPTAQMAALLGCWRWTGGEERWLFRRSGAGPLQVVRELPTSTDYRDRARIPQEVRFQPSSGHFGFRAAGQIHALIMVGTMVVADGADARLEMTVYTQHVPGEPARPTGNTMTLLRCAQ